MELPPAEERQAALTAMGIQDPFSSELRPQQRQQMLEMEEAATESIFVIMSDIQLDRPVVSESSSAPLMSLSASMNDLLNREKPHLNNGHLLLLPRTRSWKSFNVSSKVSKRQGQTRYSS